MPGPFDLYKKNNEIVQVAACDLISAPSFHGYCQHPNWQHGSMPLQRNAKLPQLCPSLL